MRKTEITANHYYHIYNRGVGKQPIFFCRENWAFMIQRLNHYFTPERAEIVAYCLMPNHYHLLVRVLCSDFGRKVMQPLTVSYTKAVNKQQNRNGHLFQGPYQARLVKRDADLINLSRYIHLNPVTAGLVSRAEVWVFSSYRDYVGLRNGQLPKPAIVLDQFPSREAYAEYVNFHRASDGGLSADILFDE
jgi:REP element-mobilizing transposase RayT